MNMRQFAINLRDGRVVLCTRETLANIDYYAISSKVAHAIETGVLDRKDIIAKVKGKLMTSQDEWDALLTQKTTQNIRHSTIDPADTEKSETVIAESDVKGEFDMDLPGEEAVEEVAEKPKKSKAKKEAASATDELALSDM